MKRVRPRSAFTIVELLVVTGLMASLFALVLTMGRPNQRSSSRRAAQEFASFLLATQTRALGVSEGAAIIVEPSSTNPSVASVVHAAFMPPLLRGRVTGMPPAPPPSPPPAGDPSAVLTFAGNLPPEADRASAYKIRFESPLDMVERQPASPWFAFVPPHTAVFRVTSGQTQANTVWPRAVGDQLDGVIGRYPQRGGEALALGKLTAIDLRFSGVGEEPTSPLDGHGYGALAGKGAIGLVYDQVGRVGEVMRRVEEAAARTSADQPIVPTQTIYFFFAPASMIANGENTLSSQSAAWVAVNPQSGRVLVAENIPRAGTTSADVFAAREKARLGVALK